ncbi:MAG: hypothetical protein QOJ26_1043, partial [Thermoplasmata archaeon]|nr:hypothetical protein [Thermoplasmata archaeon]
IYQLIYSPELRPVLRLGLADGLARI